MSDTYYVFHIFSDINAPPLIKNLPQTVSVLEGMTIGSSVYQLQVDDKDLTDSHLFFVSYSPSEGAVYFDVNKTSMLLLYYIFYWRGFTYNRKYVLHLDTFGYHITYPTQ